MHLQAVAAKKKIEGDYQELEMMLEGATHAKEDLLKQNKKLNAHLKDYQVEQILWILQSEISHDAIEIRDILKLALNLLIAFARHTNLSLSIRYFKSKS